MASNELTPNSEDRIMCVKVGKVKRENLYEMTRKYWKVDIIRARRATHVLAIVKYRERRFSLLWQEPKSREVHQHVTLEMRKSDVW